MERRQIASSIINYEIIFKSGLSFTVDTANDSLLFS